MLAIKTITAINEALKSDQGATFRTLLRDLMPQAEDAYRGEEEQHRTHLGASQIGRECSREIWYSFHWASANIFEGRMIRLFNRGHLEEPRFIALLNMIGVRVYSVDDKGKQYRISRGYKGHGGGGMDGVVIGIPDLPLDMYALAEFKTHNDKSFQKLKADGVLKAKWEHFVQMQRYMGDQKLPCALYLAVNKNDDEIYGEIIQYDASVDTRTEIKQRLIIDAKSPPPRIGGARDETFFKCSFCDHKPVCWKGAAPLQNCRTCKHVSIEDGGKWQCNLHQEFRTSEEQRLGCPQWTVHPEMNSK